MTVQTARNQQSAAIQTSILARQCAAEAIGTCLLLATIVGSGIMAENIAGNNVGLALLPNSLAVGAMLVVLILCLGPVSGAHFNPAVTLAFWLRRELTTSRALIYMAVQIASAILGTILAHLMFDLDPLTMGTHVRSGNGQWIGEAVGTFALVFAILACLKTRPDCVPYAVGLVITAGFWYTSSTSFANPAVTIARMFTDSFTAIRPDDVPAFIILQFLAAVFTVIIVNWLFQPEDTEE